MTSGCLRLFVLQSGRGPHAAAYIPVERRSTGARLFPKWCLELLKACFQMGVAGLRAIMVYKEEELLWEEHLALFTMKGTLLLLGLLVTGELSFQTSESGTLVHPISVPCRSLSRAWDRPRGPREATGKELKKTIDAFCSELKLLGLWGVETEVCWWWYSWWRDLRCTVEAEASVGLMWRSDIKISNSWMFFC